MVEGGIKARPCIVVKAVSDLELPRGTAWLPINLDFSPQEVRIFKLMQRGAYVCALAKLPKNGESSIIQISKIISYEDSSAMLQGRQQVDFGYDKPTHCNVLLS